MSESDDSDIQADIKALTEVLSLPTTSNVAYEPQEQFVSSINSQSNSALSDLEKNDEYFNYIYDSEDKEFLNVYEINEKLITGLLIAKKQLIVLLEKCEKKIKELDEKMSPKKGFYIRPVSRHAINDAGMPYFKDKNHFRAPKNYDTKLKESRGELILPFLSKPSRWSGKDREILLKAIHNEAIESVLSKGFNDEIEKPDKKTSNEEAKKIAISLPRNFRELVGAVGEKEFDWYKISRMDFENKHLPHECQVMWNVYLHPDFNKDEWTNVEDKKLLKYAKQCNYQDWDTIAQLLETNRSSYQCFIRYNTIKKVVSSGRPWTKQEDKCLANIIKSLKIEDYIPWSDVANHMRHRTKQQIYSRWTYRKAPHLRKGRFTYLETQTLLNAVEKYGMDFGKISNIMMPHRTSVQLYDRYNTVMESLTTDKMWTIDDDERLLDLHENYNNDWSKIAKYFSSKSRTQVRQRFCTIQRYLSKNIPFEDIPRPSNDEKQISYKFFRRDRDKKSRVIHIDDIRLRLYEILSIPLLKTINFQKSYDSEQLANDTKRLYDTLILLNTDLDVSSGFLNSTHLNRREKRLLTSLEEYTNVKNNRIHQIEKFRMQMFGHVEEDSENFFIPPLPFDGYIRTKKIKSNNKSIDCELINVNEKFLINVPTEFSITSYIHSFINIEEEIQFDKFGQLLISDYHECDERHINLYKLIKCNLFFDKTNTLAEYHNCGIDMNFINYKQRKYPSKLPIAYTDDEDNQEKLFSDLIKPNRATLLGLKNLLLWKLLYENENNKAERFEFFFKSENKQEQTMTNSILTQSTEYRLLQTRLRQLFKIPIGLSNCILEIQGSESMFSTKKEETQEPISKKRKFEHINCVELNGETDDHNVLANSSSQFNSNVETVVLPVVRSCRVVYKKYKIIAK
ncbi:uncharacterized protein Pbp95 [Anoplolepis gracilipes]|uniref:uncharacterized protein Pbp95 n=1 Tax=Anoplolepis gracilipes TaxID=354296 RepID=UPI003BA0B5AB